MSTKINKAIAAMAAVMTESIIKMLSQLSINELTAIGRASKAGRPAKATPSEPTPSRSKTSKPSAPKMSKSQKKSAAEMSKRGPGRPPKAVKTGPVTAEMRADLADKFFAQLSGSGEAWSKMEDVVSKVSKGLPVEIARRIMNSLISSGRVERKGSTRNSRYRVAWVKGGASPDASAGAESPAAGAAAE